MAKKLIIVESPTKANTISRFLGEDYKVESSYGHVRDLPRSRFGIDLENNFNPEYIIPIKSRKRVTELRKLAAKAKEIILASDEDREGEAIAWHLEEVLTTASSKRKPSKTEVELIEKIKTKPVHRIVFHEITKQAIESALQNPRKIKIPLVNAQQARRILDRLVGYKLSPFLWKKIAKGLSAGRVQSVVLRLIVDRENEIRAFKPEEFWSVEALLKTKRGENFTASLAKVGQESLSKLDIKNEDQAQEIASDLKGADFSVSSVKNSQVRRSPPPPFTTSTLQQQASLKLRFSAKKTMMFAQSLYERGLITYMRTDSLNLSSQAALAAKEYLQKTFGQKYALEKPRFFKNKSKLSQEAHEAIRPTSTTSPDQIEAKEEAERKLYRLIWERFLASQMPEAVFESSRVGILAKGKQKTYEFKSSGNVMLFDGFLKVYNQKTEENELPKMESGESLACEKILPAQHFTEPPPRYTEARLIKTLEEYGIGRPSTYVPIISVIQARNYVRKEGGKFTPTEIGEMVNSMLTKHFPKVVDVNFTAQMEESLDKVAEGEVEWQNLLSDFYAPFSKNLEEKYEEVEKEIKDEASDEICEKCGKPMIIKFGRFGKFLACTGFPECKNTKNFGENAPQATGMKCEKCKIGDIVQKRTFKGRRRIFWGCSRYPECDFATWNDPAKKSEQA